jgi:hemoglobin
VRPDPLLGPFFNGFIEINWEEHYKKMVSFWSNALFQSGSYMGNPMEAHKVVHSLKATRHEHFQRWLQLFEQTVDEHFIGKNARLIKEKASSIATIMQVKLFN